MPGIVGLITKVPRERAERELLRMVASLRHETSYETGTYIDESLGVYVGWIARRASFSAVMPLRNQRGDVTLVFSGEEFPNPGALLPFKDQSRALESIEALYLVHLAEEDPSFPASLNGRFHGLLVDRNSSAVSLFNDRYGMQRLYYHEANETFYFAAEAKAILAIKPELRRMDPRGLGELVGCGCVLENRTLFEGIHVLPPASAWVFRGGSSAAKRSYFQPSDWEDQDPLKPEAYYQELRETFSRNLPRYFAGAEKVGMSVTGGLDTRMVLAYHQAAPRTLPCYSFGGSYRESQDVILGRRVAEACGQTHEVIPVADSFLSRFPHYAERAVYLTDGCIGVNHSPDLYVNELAAKIAPVRMTGNYGGEVLRRVRAFKPAHPTPGLFRAEMMSQVRAAHETYGQVIQGHPLSFAVFRQAPWHHYGLLSLEQTQLALRSPFLDNEFVRTVFRAPASACSNDDVSLRLIAEGNPALRHIRTDRGLIANSGPLSLAVLKGFLEFTAKSEYAYDYGMPQWVAGIDHTFAPLHLERLFLGRHKFYHFRVWYRDALSKYVREMLLDPRTLSRPYLERKAIEPMVKAHVKGNRNYTTEIHQLLTLEYIHRLFIDSSGTDGPAQSHS
jgi:asparagine synthase (glutamine-hydrolysing)